MAVNKLKHTSDDFPEITLVGITTTLEDYRMAFFINKETPIKLERLDNLPVFDEKLKDLIAFTLYLWHDDDQRLSYYLISNEHEQGKLISLYPHANYFLLIKGRRNDVNSKNLLSTLRKLPLVSFVFLADISKIKELNGILYDLELHELSQFPKKATF